MSLSKTVRCIQCRGFVQRTTTESIRRGDMVGLVCKSHRAKSDADIRTVEKTMRATWRNTKTGRFTKAVAVKATA